MLTEIQQEFGVEVVAINILPQVNSLQDWQAFLKKFGAGNFVVALDTNDGRAVQAYKIQALGVTVIVGRDKRVAYCDTKALMKCCEGGFASPEMIMHKE